MLIPGEMRSLTLALIKPHVLKIPLALNNIQTQIVESGLEIVARKTILFDEALAKQFYNEHKGRFFFNRLVTYMMSGPSEAFVLSGTNAISKWRDLMGPTKFYKGIYVNRDCIRSTYGFSDTRNAAHGSDSPESASKEISILFPEIKIDLNISTSDPSQQS